MERRKPRAGLIVGRLGTLPLRLGQERKNKLRFACVTMVEFIGRTRGTVKRTATQCSQQFNLVKRLGGAYEVNSVDV